MLPAPETQHLPIPRATTAACEVIPPLAVRIPLAMFMPSRSSGEVSILTRIDLGNFSASSAKNTTCPLAAPGDAASPFVISLLFSNEFSSNTGCSNSSSLLGSTLRMAVFSSIEPSLSISMAILTIAAPVRFPLRVCSNQSFPSWIVNSRSCISE